MTLPDMFRNLTGVLRYFATAVVGVCIVAVFDRGHDAMGSLVLAVWIPGTGAEQWPPAWATIGALATLGLLSYAVHRILLHPLFARLVRRICGRGWSSDEVLHRARWVRRGANEGDPARSVQNALDEFNATAHFFYCSAWSAVIGWFVVSRTVANLDLTAGFWVTCVALLGVGFIADCRAARSDAEEQATST